MSDRNSIRGTTLLFTSIFFSLAIAFVPSSTHAATDLNVRQALPPAAINAACAPILVSEVHPYIYNGTLDSFEFTISAPSYVALGGSVGETPIGFQYMTRWQERDGNVRIHVDIPSTSLSNSLPVHVILISAAGKVICTANVSTIVPKVAPIPIVSSSPSIPTAHIPSSYPAPTTHDKTSSSHVTPPSRPTVAGQGSTTVSESATSSAMFVGALHSLGNLCQVGGASRLWIVLVVLYGLFVLTLLLQKSDTFGVKSLEWNIALILILFLGLLAFWYFSLPCRTGSWAPAITAAIAIFGLICLLVLGKIEERPVLLLEDSDE